MGSIGSSGAAPTGSIGVGTRVRFRAATPNTGSATINLDGHGARQCRTITGAVLPAGYIRSDAETEATFNGTHWILNRETESGSNSNGIWFRFADGRQYCESQGLLQSGTIQNNYGSVFVDGQQSWTYPIGFVSPPIPSFIVQGSLTVWIVGRTGSSQTATFQCYRAVANDIIYSVSAQANGYWY